MDDTISRQAAIDAIEEYSDRLQMVNWKENSGVPYKVHALNWCVNTIRELPSAEPERKKGKWIATQEWGGRNYSCSCCKFSFIVDTCMLEPMWNFCPNCGAEIEGRR